MRLVSAHVPAATDAELLTGLVAGQSLHSLGITNFQDACVGAAGELGMPDSFGTYLMAADYGMLDSHVVGALWWDRDRGLGQIDDLLARREQANGPASPGQHSPGQHSPGQHSSGRPRSSSCSTASARRSPPRCPLRTWTVPAIATDHSGRLFIEPEELTEAVRRLGAAGFQLHFHAIGDLAVSTALDALAALPDDERRAARHHLAHLQFITPRDMARFAELGVVANFQPLWACAGIQMEELTLPFVGAERALWQYQIGSLLGLGTRVAFGSDWPVSSADPLQEIHVAVNRVLSERLGRPGMPECVNPFLPDQAITVDAAVDAFTSGVAWVVHKEDVAGPLCPGCGPTWPCLTRTCSLSRRATLAAPRW